MLIEAYQAEWVENFKEIEFEIQCALGEFEYGIEHVGSTAVPGLASKPIIDIDIIYQTDSEFERIKSSLLEIGYYHNGNQGIKNREVFKRNGMSKNVILDKIKHHLYVCLSGTEALNRHILFRDYLRKSESAKLEYQMMKYKLAEVANQNKKVYAGLKEVSVNDFIDSIIEK